MSARKFVPFEKRDIKILYLGTRGVVLPNVSQKISGAEKVAQMCVIIFLKYLDFEKRIFDSYPHRVVSEARKMAAECLQYFENDPEQDPNNNLFMVELEKVRVSHSTGILDVQYRVITQAGEQTLLRLPLPLFGGKEIFKRSPNPFEDGPVLDIDITDWEELQL